MRSQAVGLRPAAGSAPPLTGAPPLAVRIRLLEWMRRQDFERVRGELLVELERLVVSEHASLHSELLAERWSPPDAYRWIRYEDPDPIARLIDASGRLARGWSEAAGRPGFAAARSSFEAEEALRLAKAVRLARALGYDG